jgi:hypothetical protein
MPRAWVGVHIEPHGTDTALTGDLNRSGLHDLLTCIRDLALDLAGLTCLVPELSDVVRPEGGRVGQATVSVSSPLGGGLGLLLVS